jgi:Uma2 family endonuclease
VSTITRHITTAEQLLAAGDIGRCELIRGELRMMTPAGWDHGVIAGELFRLLSSYVRKRKLGQVSAAETGYMLSHDTVLAPDVGFVRKARVPRGAHPAFFKGAPDLAAEVLSPDDRSSEVLEKAHEWLVGGSALVWIVDPRSRTVTVHREAGPPDILKSGEMLDGENVVPGFRVRIARLFDLD